MIMMNSQYQPPVVNDATAAFSTMPQQQQQQQQQVQPSSFLTLRESVSSSSSSNTSATSTFPMKLHAMLSDAAAMHFDSIVCWLPGGQAFKVLDPKRFSEQVMPRYFNQTKFKSFQRQLNIYGFQRVHHGPHKGGYTHPYCVQGYPDLCEQIKREGSSSSSNSPAMETTTPSSSMSMPLLKPKSAMAMSCGGPVSQQAQQQLVVDPMQPFAWDVEAEAAFGGVDGNAGGGDLFESTVDEIAAFAMSSQLLDSAGTAAAPRPMPPQQQQQQQRPVAMKRSPFTTKNNTVLNSEDISFFKNLFQPGDVAQEKEILDSFRMPQEQRQLQCQAPPMVQPQQQPQQFYQPAPVVQQQQQQYQVAAPMPVQAASAPAPVAVMQQEPVSTAAASAAAPIVTSAAISEYNFPRKLYRLLQDCESNPEYRSIVSWSVDGTSFKVHCKKRFVSVILPNYFDQTQYASFRRQLNMYSFLRQSMSTYANPFFLRGRRELLDNVVRKNGNGSTATATATKKD